MIPLVLSVLFVPVVEEIAFRSIGHRGLARRVNTVVAAIVVSSWFALLHHADDISFVGRTFLLSLLMIWLMHKTQSLWPAIAAHASHNALVVVLGAIEAQIVRWGRTLT